MANRILLGERNGDFGLWVSKPGRNVLTAGEDDLLLSPDREMLQVIYAERRSYTARPYPNNTLVFTWPDPGYYAFVWLHGPAGPTFVWNNRSRITVSYNPNATPREIAVIVFNKPRNP